MGYSKQVYDRVWETLAERRRQSRARTARNRERIHGELPEVADIEREMALQASSIAKAVVADPANAGQFIDRLAQENLALQDRRAALLHEHGYSEDILAEQHVCERCKDTGLVGQSRCECFLSLLRQEAARQLSSKPFSKECTFDSFKLHYYPTGPVDGSNVIPGARMEEILNFCQSYAETFSPESASILMMGKTGLGKTHLSLAIAHEVTAAGFGVIYTPAHRLMEALEAEKFSRDGKAEYAELTGHYLDCDLLVLDDLGSEFANSFSYSALYNLINSRLVDGRPTIISTNLEFDEIEERYKQRMLSRLVGEYKVLKFVGKDVRNIKAIENARSR